VAIRRGALVIVGRDQKTTETVGSRLRAHYGDAFDIEGVDDAEEAILKLRTLQRQSGLEVPVILVDRSLLFEDESRNTGLIEMLRDEVLDTTRIVGFTELPLDEIRERALAEGICAYVHVNDVEAAVDRIMLANELGALDTFLPAVDEVVNTIYVGVSIQNPTMDVLWANKRTEALVDAAGVGRQKCWDRYHRFNNRTCACTDCTAHSVLQCAREEAEAGKQISNGRMTGYHLLPVRGKIARVEVNASPLLSRDRRKILAITEATRIVTADWKDTTAAYDRFCQVVETARRLGKHASEAPPIRAVAVYYRPEPDGDLHLFSAATDRQFTHSRLLRLTECPYEYRQCLADRSPKFFTESVASTCIRHFLWVGTASSGIEVLVDVMFSDRKPEGLFTSDLRPYWEYVIENFDDARESREEKFDQSTNSCLQAFLAQASNGIRDEATLNRTLRSAKKCVRDALGSLSMYVRVVDRESNTLEKRRGYGPYYDMAPERRQLRHDGIGSGSAASRRQAIICDRPDMEEVLRCVGRDVTQVELAELKRIAGYATMPLVCNDRVLGTLCIQFGDDSLVSDAKRNFVEALANALGNALGNLQWARDRTTMVDYSRGLDTMMFLRSQKPEEEEVAILARVTRMVFQLTAAEIVAYYRYDPQSQTLTLATGATVGTPPDGMMLPDVIHSDAGILSQTARWMRGRLFGDYRDDRWREGRQRLLNAHSSSAKDGFCRWVRSVAAEPGVAGGKVKGVLVAFSSIPNWLTTDDLAVVRDFAVKTGLCLEAKQLMRRLNWVLGTEISLNEITAVMARIADDETLHRLFLLAITADECLGFTRAVFFRRVDGDDNRLAACEAVGARERSAAEDRWREASFIMLSEKMRRCEEPREVRPGDLQEDVVGLTLDLNELSHDQTSFREGKTMVRRRGQPHLFREPKLLRILRADANHDREYVLAPLTAGGVLLGAVLADRAFLPSSDIEPQRLDLLQLLTSQFALILEANRFRQEEQEAAIARRLASGINYSLRTRAAALEARLAIFAREMGDRRPDAIPRMKRAVKFFGRAGTLATKLLRMGDQPHVKGTPINLRRVVASLVDTLADRRVILVPDSAVLRVAVEQYYLEDLLLEVLWNACEITDQTSGRITVTVSQEGTMARVDCVDNGPGILPDFETQLFEPFQCYPVTRMGLGLYYAARIVEACGGSIEEIGVWQEGAHFVIRIPLSEDLEDAS